MTIDVKDKSTSLKAPFPYFGGKSRIAVEIWKHFGNIDTYLEPFCGSAAVLLARPNEHQWWNRSEILNDADGMVSNFWRAAKNEPEKVAYYADWPIIENDLHARHSWLVDQKHGLQVKLEGNPDYYDAKIAGYWCWGISTWLHGFCSADGPWHSIEGKLTKMTTDGAGVKRSIFCRVNRGVNRSLVDTPGTDSQFYHDISDAILQWILKLQNRLRRVQVACGDWTRICNLKLYSQPIGVFLDPPYGLLNNKFYTEYPIGKVHTMDEVIQWAIGVGNAKEARIALCSHDNIDMPPNWSAHRWTAPGYGISPNKSGKNRRHEVIWFSPNYVKEEI